MLGAEPNQVNDTLAINPHFTHNACFNPGTSSRRVTESYAGTLDESRTISPRFQEDCAAACWISTGKLTQITMIARN
jgi:hypothetical protein